MKPPVLLNFCTRLLFAVGDVDISSTINSHAGRAVKLTRPEPVRSPPLKELAGRCKPVDRECAIGGHPSCGDHQHVPGGLDRNAGGGIQRAAPKSCRNRGRRVETAARCAEMSPLPQERAAAREYLHAKVPRIGDIDVSVVSYRNADRAMAIVAGRLRMQELAVPESFGPQVRRKRPSAENTCIR